MMRRCNYDFEIVSNAVVLVGNELLARTAGSLQENVVEDTKLAYYVEQYNRSTVADVVILPYLDESNIAQLSSKHLAKLAEIMEQMLQHEPFEVITVHDAFHSLPKNCNWVRYHYKEILADLADSDLLADLLGQVYGVSGTFDKLSKNLGDTIRNSNYALS